MKSGKIKLQKNTIRACLVHALVFYAPLVSAIEIKSNYWELGLGAVAFQTPHYLGADQSKNYVLPYPHARLETEYLSVDRSVISAHAIESKVFELDVSFAGELKVDSEDNRLRQGMPDLEYILEAGPSFNWLLDGEFDSEYSLTFDLPVRSVWATDLDEVDQTGWRMNPTLHWFKMWQDERSWEVENKFRLLFGTSNYHDYFYTVIDDYVTVDRPRYLSETGYGGWQYSLNIKTRRSGVNYGFVFIYSDISNAVYEDSPMVAQDTNYSVGVYVSWVLAEGRFYSLK